MIVLIDEVESIAYSRGAVTDNEPTDSLRVVNAVLTQLDRLRTKSNVLVLSTSNVTQCIDAAFLDRADVVQYIGPPTVEAIRFIYTEAIIELIRVGIVQKSNTDAMIKAELDRLAEASKGLSGRSVRKIPFLAHSTFEQQTHIPILDYIDAMVQTAEKQLAEKQGINWEGKTDTANELLLDLKPSKVGLNGGQRRSTTAM